MVHDAKPAAILLNSILPCLWLALFAWLFRTNTRRKMLLWMFCLVPPVFYYLANDLYYVLLSSN
jgi:hypothetical protein